MAARAQEEQDVRRLLDATLILVDGPYRQEERDWDAPFRGSRNQRLVLVQESLAAGKIIEAAARA